MNSCKHDEMHDRADGRFTPSITWSVIGWTLVCFSPLFLIYALAFTLPNK